MNTRLALISVLAGSAVVAGCGSGGNGTASNASATTSGGTGAIAVSDTGDVGKVLVDGQGRTLYIFARDSAGKSNCSGACATNWPPAAGAPKAGSGVSKMGLKTIMRAGGGRQLTYAGHPLYRYSGDRVAGTANGQGLNAFGGQWYAVTAAGAADTQSSSASGGGRGGYGGFFCPPRPPPPGFPGAP